MVPDRVLQNSLEEKRKLVCGFRRILVDQLEHRVLDDVQRHLLIPDRKQRMLVGAPFDLRKETGDLLFGSQIACSPVISCPGLDRDEARSAMILALARSAALAASSLRSHRPGRAGAPPEG